MNNSILIFSIIACFPLSILCIKTQLTGTTYSRVANRLDTSFHTNRSISSYGGSQIVAQRNDTVNLHFVYQIPSDLVNKWTTGSATITHADAHATIASGTDVTVTTSLVSKQAINYSPGRETNALFTAAFTTTSTEGTTTQYMGALSENDGFAVGFQNDSFGVLHRRNGSQVSFTTQPNFNVDPLDGSGPSGFVLDPTQINIYSITYGWIEACPITFLVMREDGYWIPFHRIQYNNKNTLPSIYNPSLPIAAEITKSSSDATNLQIKTASWSGTITGNQLATRHYVVRQESVSISGASDQVCHILHNKQQYNGASNTGKIRLLYFAAHAQETSQAYIFSFIKNATITSPSYSDINALSLVEASTSGSISGGDTLLQLTGYARKQFQFPFKKNNFQLDVFPNETVSLVCHENSGGNITVNYVLLWEEFY